MASSRRVRPMSDGRSVHTSDRVAGKDQQYCRTLHACQPEAAGGGMTRSPPLANEQLTVRGTVRCPPSFVSPESQGGRAPCNIFARHRICTLLWSPHRPRERAPSLDRRYCHPRQLVFVPFSRCLDHAVWLVLLIGRACLSFQGASSTTFRLWSVISGALPVVSSTTAQEHSLRAARIDLQRCRARKGPRAVTSRSALTPIWKVRSTWSTNYHPVFNIPTTDTWDGRPFGKPTQTVADIIALRQL